jgi:hypothetical protein
MMTPEQRRDLCAAIADRTRTGEAYMRAVLRLRESPRDPDLAALAEIEKREHERACQRFEAADQAIAEQQRTGRAPLRAIGGGRC